MSDQKLGQILEKLLGHIFIPIMKLRMFVLMKSETSLKMGHVGSKTRSLDQILEKPCVRCRSHMFVLMKSWTSSKLGNIGSKLVH